MKREIITAAISIKKRMKDSKGFSLAETLLAVLILLLVSVIVMNGMPAATNAYNKVILGANARTMLSTAITALHDEIGTAWKVDTDPSDTRKLSYFNASTGAKSIITCEATEEIKNESIKIQNYVALSGDLIHDFTIGGVNPIEGSIYELVSGVGIKPKMYVTYDEIGYSNGIVTIKGLRVCKDTDDAPDPVLASFTTKSGSTDMTIRVISADKTDA